MSLLPNNLLSELETCRDKAVSNRSYTDSYRIALDGLEKAIIALRFVEKMSKDIKLEAKIEPRG